MHFRMILRQNAHRALSLLLSSTLVMGQVPASALAATDRSLPAPTAEQIEQMLQQRAYVPGEVLVVAEAGARLDGGQSEQLAQTDDEAVDLTADAALAQPDTAQAVSAERAQASDATGYEVTVVRSETKTTAQLIEELYANPQVISVEPNYISSAPDEGAPAGSSADALVGMDADTAAAADYPEVGDLSPQQWYLHNTGTYGTPEGAAVEGVDMGIPGWDAFRAGSSAESTVNSSGVIAIVDSGMDVNHPDIKKVLYTFTPEQQARFNCGPHGLDASQEAGGGDVNDYNDHGTHVSGVAAAAWDREGVSGVANGAKLIQVRVGGKDGSQSMEAGVRAFGFLIKCAKEINLKSVNCSWAAPGVEFTYTLLINQLGMQGAVTVFASGNENNDSGVVIDTSDISNSPYLISVDALNPAGERIGFSNYSATSTDVFAPGAQMLSTVPSFVDMSAAGLENKIERSYLPTSATDEGLLAFETFAQADSSQTVVYDGDPTQPGAKQIGTIAREYGVDDAYSYKVPTADIKDEEDASDDLGGLGEAATVEDAADDGVAEAADDSVLPEGEGDAAPTDAEGVREDEADAGDPEESPSVEEAPLEGVAVGEGEGAATSGDGFAAFGAADEPAEDETEAAHSFPKSFYLAVPVADKDAAITYVSMRITADKFSMDQQKVALFGVVARKKDGGTKLVDLSNDSGGYFESACVSTGWFSWLCSTLNVAHLIEADDEVDGVYRDEQGRIILKVAVDNVLDYEALYLDNLAIGGPGAKAGAYRVMNGTSMAAPAVSGALAVIAKDEPANAASDDPAMLALERAARLRAATVWSSSLDGLCATGGYVNLREYSSLSSTVEGKKAPIITSAKMTDDNHLNVEGYFFGAQGSALVDGSPVEASAWDENGIVLTLPADLPNGAHVLTVIGQDGRDKYAFSTSAHEDEDQLKLYETELSVPDFSQVSDVYGEKGFGPFRGCMVGSGDNLYLMHTFAGEKSGYLWRYNIPEDTWTMCAKLPVSDEYEPYGNILAATKDGGLLLYVCENTSSETDATVAGTQSLYDYDPTSDSWTKRDVSCELPNLANIFTVGDDVYFVGGALESADRDLQLSVLRAGASQLEILDAPAKDEYAPPFFPLSIAVSDGYIYATSGKTTLLKRLKIDDSYHVVEDVDLTEALRGKTYDARKVTNPPVVAATPEGAFVIGTELDGTDTFYLANGSNELVPFDYTSSFYKTNEPLGLWYNGVLYVMGYSPSEPNRIYFRAHGYPVDSGGKQPVTPTKPEKKPAGTPKGAPSGSGAKSNGKPTAATGKALPRTGDEPLPIAAVALAGAIAVTLGVSRRSRRGGC